MRIVATGYDPERSDCPKRLLLEMLRKEWPELVLRPELDPTADVLVVLLDREAAPRLFSKTMPSERTLVIGIVLECHRATLPILKLFDRVVYTTDSQRRVVEDLLGLDYDARVMPLPSGGFRAARGRRGECLVWFDDPFDATQADAYLRSVQLAARWHPGLPVARLRVLFDVAPGDERAFRALAQRIEALEPEGALSDRRASSSRLESALLHGIERLIRHVPRVRRRFVVANRRGLSIPEVRATLSRCVRGQFFQNGLTRERFDAALARRDAGLLDEVLADSQILADFGHAGIRMAPVAEISAHNLEAGLTTTYAAFAGALRELADRDREGVLELKRRRFDAVQPDRLDDLDLVHGRPLDNDFVFSVCFRNQAAKLGRCLESVARQDRSLDFGVVIVDDCSTDGSLEVVREVLAAHPIPACVVRNRERRWAARNLHNVVHLLTTKNDTVILEVDGDDFLAGDAVLEVVKRAYDEGAQVTRGAYRVFPHEQHGFTAADVALHHATMDFAQPWNLGRCTSWLHLRTSRRELLSRVELEHFCDRRTGMWLTERHDTAIQPRVIELAEGRCALLTEVLYNYDVSGDHHDHDLTRLDEERIKLFRDLDRIWHPVLLTQSPRPDQSLTPRAVASSLKCSPM